jgi:hypothetical protein
VSSQASAAGNGQVVYRVGDAEDTSYVVRAVIREDAELGQHRRVEEPHRPGDASVFVRERHLRAVRWG